jgi:thiamine-monophosphate kinase
MFENAAGRTELSSVGEFGLIEIIARSVVLHHPETLQGIGDDAAVIESGHQVLLVSTDTLAEGVHFDLTYTPLKHLGYKAIVANLSDIYAMNAIPKQVLTSLAVSNRFSLEAVEEIYSGINMACKHYRVDLVGGDTNSSASGLILSVVAIGTANKEDVVYRHTASANDLICVTGDLGAAYMGLQLLNREKRIFLENPSVQPDLTGYDYLLERQLKPEARQHIIEFFRSSRLKPTSMIDISDGLASELFHLCTRSGTGCLIYENKIPVDIKTAELAEEMHLHPITCALNGGEDYELLFTIHPSDLEKVKGHKDISVIGYMTAREQGLKMIAESGQEVELKAQGWNAFRQEK